MSLLYVKLDANYSDDEKIILAGEKAELLYIRGLCLVKRILSDGFIADVHIPRFGLPGHQARARRLTEVGLWERDDAAGGYWIVAWLKHNHSAEQVDEIRAKRREAGSRGGKQRARQRVKQDASKDPSKSPSKPGTQSRDRVETEAEKPPRSPPRGARGERLPEGWTPEVEEELQTEAVSAGVDLRRQLDRFRDYWRAQSGQRGRKVDWQATWRNWLRKEIDDRPGSNGDRYEDSSSTEHWRQVQAEYDRQHAEASGKANP